MTPSTLSISSSFRPWRAAVFLLCASLLPTVAQASNALDVLRATTEALSAEVEQNRDAIAADPGVARAVVRKVLTPKLDLERTSRWVLGKHWRTADDGQKARFIQEFRTLLVRTYARAVAELAGVNVEYLPIKESGSDKDVTVQTQIPRAGDAPIGVYYRMYNGTEGWKVYDVAIDGVSLVTTYRSSFSRVVRTDGMDGLIDRLAEKNRSTGQNS